MANTKLSTNGNNCHHDLDSKVIILTGAASGIGKAEAETFSAEGARVVLTDVNEAGVQHAAKKLGKGAIALRHDVSAESDWNAVVAKTVETFGRIDGLVNNAGIYLRGTIDATTVEVFDKLFAVNQRGTFLGIKTVSAQMRLAGHPGSIVNISSITGITGLPGAIAYTATKWAIRGQRPRSWENTESGLTQFCPASLKRQFLTSIRLK
jgi:NAD(P)-dependent dehydrogenase (short-subunit alcohol dehydrogenase family)